MSKAIPPETKTKTDLPQVVKVGKEKMSDKIEATIIEAGNGLPGVGSLVYDSTTNCVYRVVATNGRIATNGPGCGNSIEATLTEADESDPTAYSDEEWEEVSDCRVDVAESEEDSL